MESCRRRVGQEPRVASPCSNLTMTRRSNLALRRSNARDAQVWSRITAHMVKVYSARACGGGGALSDDDVDSDDDDEFNSAPADDACDDAYM